MRPTFLNSRYKGARLIENGEFLIYRPKAVIDDRQTERTRPAAALEFNKRAQRSEGENWYRERGETISINILLIEDESDIRTILKDALEWEGYTVYTASNGQEGMELLLKMPTPHLILLDLMMPVMNGWEFVNALQTERDYIDIPIVALSAFSDPQKKIRAKGFIKKPVDLDLLLDLVKEHCRPGANLP
jgi:CheY-like chemotaxis protein